MKLAIVVTRSPQYRQFAPIVEAALQRGCVVECWHDASQPRTGMKGYQFPSHDAAPAFRHGHAAIRDYHGAADLKTRVAGGEADAIVSIDSPEVATGAPLPPAHPLWIRLQSLFYPFMHGGPEQLSTSDRLALYSPWWLQWAAGWWQYKGLIADPAAFVRDAMTHATFVGLPELDVVASIDPDEVRHRWGIGPRQPVVVLLPFPQGVGWASFWPKRIFAEPSPLKQLAYVVARRRFDYLPYIWNGWSDRNVLRTLRAFCDRAGAFLLIKSRLKTPVPPYAAALANKVVYDEGYYPGTDLEALRVASLCVSYYSNAVFESVALGVPHLCLTYPLKEYLGQDPGYLSGYYSPEEGSPFQFPGAATALSVPEAVTRLSRATLADFAMDSRAREGYIAKFVTHADGDGGARVVDMMIDAVRQRGTPALR